MSGCPGLSLYVISFTRPSQALVLQVINAGVRRPGNEATSDVLIIGTYATLVPHDGNIQGCEILKKYLFLKMWVFIHINLDRIMNVISC